MNDFDDAIPWRQPDAEYANTREGILAELLQKVRANVDRWGWHMTSVFPKEDDPLRVFWSYTTGLLKTYNHPELIIFGLLPDVAHAVLSSLIEQIKEGRVFQDGEQASGLLRNNFDLFFRSAPCDDFELPLSVTRRYYARADVATLQVVLPDPQNLFPWQPGCDPAYVTSQQVLVRSR